MLKPFVFDRDKNIVETVYGKVRGFQYDGIYVFEGIPYAEAERFHAPHPPKKWEKVHDCSVYGCVSPLLHFTPPSGDHLLIPHRYWVQGENCQNLNVWTASINSDERKPVLVWIHGGGFSDGSSIEAPFYDGLNFARHNDCVFVSINHRLNIFGYLDVSSYGKEYYNSGNNGQLDIIEALKWVRDNIGKFGGASVLLKRAPEGTGVIAGGPARAVIELAGIKNIRTKSLGSNNKQNVVFATLNALKALKTPEEVARLRGKSVEEILA